MNDLLATVYKSGRADDWTWELIGSESDKVHETARSFVKTLTTVLCAPNASKDDKAWARKRIDSLMGFEEG